MLPNSDLFVNSNLLKTLIFKIFKGSVVSSYFIMIT